MQTFVLVIGLGLFHAVAGSAQAARDTSTAKMCRGWVSDFARGDRAKIKGASGRSVDLCGTDGAVAMANALRKYRNETDVNFLNSITLGTRHQQDRRVADAALEVARDETASREARVLSIRALISLLRPGSRLSYQDLKADSHGRSQSCGGGSTPNRHVEVVEPLPADFHGRFTSEMDELVREAGTPIDVRAAASCALVHEGVSN